MRFVLPLQGAARSRLVGCGLVIGLLAAFPHDVSAAPGRVQPGPDSAPATQPTDPPTPPPPSPADPQAPVSDPRLLQAIADATGAPLTQRLPVDTDGDGIPDPDAPRRVNRVDPTATVVVEVLTQYDQTIADAIRALGGEVQGTIDGQLVQGRVPADRIDDLALTDGVTYMRAPRRVNRRPESVDIESQRARFGSTLGAHVAAINADDWQTAGFDGSGVKVGIIDYFFVDTWNASEQGSKPTLANGRVFCQDTSGFPVSLCNPDGSIDNDQGDTHGLAVAEVIKDVAPGAQLYIATVGTTADLQAAIDWFDANGVDIITRSLGSAYDGAGDGTGPLAAVVDYAAAKGITWFNSGGNDAADFYMRTVVSGTLGNNTNGASAFSTPSADLNETSITPTTDAFVRIDLENYGTPGDPFGCMWLDGIRWSDWGRPVAQRSDYAIDFFGIPATTDEGGQHTNPAGLRRFAVIDANQTAGAPPLEAADEFICPQFFEYSPGVEYNPQVAYIRIRKTNAAADENSDDIIEIGLAGGYVEVGYDDVSGSAAKPVVDSANQALVAVGASDVRSGYSSISFYSSQGPTNDGRIKPDIAAPDCMATTQPDLANFCGTSAAAPTAAAAAALLLEANLAIPGAALGNMIRHVTVDAGAVGTDNAFGRGRLVLPDPPGPAPALSTDAYTPLAATTRVLDTRPSSQVGPLGLIGPHPRGKILDVPILGANGIPASGVTAVAVTVTSASTTGTGFVQALPTLRGTVGATSTLNVAVPGAARPNFAIVPIGQNGRISVYLQAGGDAIIDIQGYFAPVTGSVSAGRLVPIAPERWTDTRTGGPLPVYGNGNPGGGARPVAAAETVEVVPLPTTAVPTTGVAALVVNVTGTDAAVNGFLRALPTGASGTHSTVNVRVGSASASGAIVAVGGTSGSISVYAHTSMNVIVDVVGYITDGAVASDTGGLFVAVTPGRNYDSRLPSPNPVPLGTPRTITLSGLTPPAADVPTDAIAVSANVTVTGAGANGNLKIYPTTEPTTSSLNFAAGQTVANGVITSVDAGTITVKPSQTAHVIVDINGYFTPPAD